MPVHFKPAEPPARAVRRICREHITKALARLRRSRHPAAVHGARKEIKKLRAVLRLVRGEIGRGVYRPAAKALRRGGGPRAGARRPSGRDPRCAGDVSGVREAGRTRRGAAVPDPPSGATEKLSPGNPPISERRCRGGGEAAFAKDGPWHGWPEDQGVGLGGIGAGLEAKLSSRAAGRRTGPPAIVGGEFSRVAQAGEDFLASTPTARSEVALAHIDGQTGPARRTARRSPRPGPVARVRRETG